MKDLYLSFNDEEQAKAILYRTEGVEAEGNAIEVPNFRNTDVIGVIYKPTGEVEQTEMGEVPVLAPIPGWHVNVRVIDDEDSSTLEQFAVIPKTPLRVWG